MKEMTKLKICGIRRLEDTEILNTIQPDFAGFVFADSKRQVTFDEARTLRRDLDNSIQTVGVFVDAELNFIQKLVEEGVIQYIQLHGAEDSRYIQALREKTAVPIIKATRVFSRNDVEEETHADIVLYDAYHKELRGGTGETFNWNLLKGKTDNYFLAGGLTAENIQKAIRQLNPYAVDVSSGVETNGYKDKEKLIELKKNIQEAAK